MVTLAAAFNMLWVETLVLLKVKEGQEEDPARRERERAILER